MSPAQEHYFRLLDSAQSHDWGDKLSMAKQAADRAASVVKVANRADALRRLVSAAQSGDSAALAALKAQAAKTPTKAMLATGGLGLGGGYLLGKDRGEDSAGEQAAAGFGAGIATGLAAPSILQGLNELVANQGLLPAGMGGISPNDLGYYTQI